MSDLVNRLHERAESYRQGGPSSEHTAVMLDEAASRISKQDAELERLRREVEEARAKLFPYADATEISGISFDGKYLIGDKKSISYFHEMKNRGEQIDVYARAYEQRIAAAEAKLAEARKAAFIEAAEIAEETAQGSDHLLKAAGQAKDIQGALVHGEGVMTARIIATALRRKAEGRP